ncbi:MAG: hypothetical protein IT210_26510 [Armatimonadetes bacterium]|nr:hypothetical protein [Armatimonadota bacterium]
MRYWRHSVGLLLITLPVGLWTAGCGQGSGQAGAVVSDRSRVSRQLDTLVLINHWLRVFYSSVFPYYEDPFEDTPSFQDAQGRYHWKSLYASGRVDEFVLSPADFAFTVTTRFNDGSWQKFEAEAPVENGDIVSTRFSLDFSDGARLEYATRTDRKGTRFDPTDDDTVTSGLYTLPDGSKTPFSQARRGFDDRLTATLPDGRLFEMTARITPEELMDTTVPMEGKLTAGDASQITYKLRLDPDTQQGWIWELKDPSQDSLSGRFRLEPELSGIGQWQSGGRVESAVSWQMPVRSIGSGGLPGKLEARVTSGNADSYIAGPSAAALVYLNRYWDALTAPAYIPVSALQKAVPGFAERAGRDRIPGRRK